MAAQYVSFDDSNFDNTVINVQDALDILHSTIENLNATDILYDVDQSVSDKIGAMNATVTDSAETLENLSTRDITDPVNDWPLYATLLGLNGTIGGIQTYMQSIDTRKAE